MRLTLAVAAHIANGQGLVPQNSDVDVQHWLSDFDTIVAYSVGADALFGGPGTDLLVG